MVLVRVRFPLTIRVAGLGMARPLLRGYLGMVVEVFDSSPESARQGMARRGMARLGGAGQGRASFEGYPAMVVRRFDSAGRNSNNERNIMIDIFEAQAQVHVRQAQVQVRQALCNLRDAQLELADAELRLAQYRKGLKSEESPRKRWFKR